MKDKSSKGNKETPKEISTLAKAQLCMGLITVIEGQEKMNIEELTTRVMELNEDFGEQEAKDYLTSFIVVNCIENLTPKEFETLNDHVKSLTEWDYTEYSNGIKFNEIKKMIMDNDTAKIEKYTQRVKKIDKDYHQEYQEFLDKRGSGGIMGKGDLGLFGSKFKDMDKKKINLIGFGLLLLVGAILTFFALKLMKKDKKKKNKKEKKKNN